VSRAEHAALRRADPHALRETQEVADERRGEGGEPKEDEEGGEWRVWGAAYRVPAAHAQDALAALDVREQNGYATRKVRFVPASPPAASTTTLAHDAAAAAGAFECLVYIGTPANPQFVGPSDGPLLQLARRVLACRGPSGENREYVYRLEEALRDLVPAAGEDGARRGGPGVLDPYVQGLAALCRELERQEKEAGKGGRECGGVVGEGEHAGDVMEEVEVQD
jgi:cation transport regulator ChaC